MSRKNKILLLASVLVIALLVGAGITEWGASSNASFALEQPQTSQPQPVSEIQAELAQVMPTQAVLSSLYDAVAPSVVNIQVTQAAEASAQGIPSIPGFPFSLPDDQSQNPPTVQGQGSGFIYDNDGHIVTNNHVVADATSIVVYFSNGMWADADLVARDPAADLAVIKVTPPDGVNWQPLSLAPADSLRVGYYVAALGSPFGLQETMTTGVVSAIGRSFPTGDTTGGPTYSLPDVVQTDAAINPGNSGGPLLNLNGEVVGVNFAINSPVRANSGVGFAIPVSVVHKVVPALIKDGGYSYSYLGIAGSTIDANVAEAEGINANQLGVYVGQVVSGGPAAAAGVQEGDVVRAIGDQPVTAFEDLISYLFQSTEPGDTVSLTILRNGDTQTVDVELATRPEGREVAQQTDQPREASVSIAEAIRTARAAVSEAGLMDKIDSANARPDEVDGRSVWVVTLSGSNSTATVTVDAQSGEVLELNVQ